MTAQKRKKITPHAAPALRNRCRALILVDEKPIRTKALRDCKTVMRQIEKTKKDWSRYNEKDKPAFTRWFHREFGSFLTEIQTEGARLHEKRLLVETVQTEAYFMGTSYRTAYQSVMEQRENPGGGKETEDDEDDFFDDEEEEDEYSARKAREQMFRDMFGIDPDSDPDLFDDIFGDGGNGSFFDEDDEEYEREFESRKRPAPPKETPSEKSHRRRVKELYRVLARSLHPDIQGEGDPRKKELWNQVQEAYEKEDLEGLETLRALSDVEAGKIAEGTGIFHLKQVWRQLKNSLNALRASLRKAKKDPAWGFVTRKDTTTLRKTISKELRAELQRLKIEHQALEDLISKWTKPRSKPRAASKTKKSPYSQDNSSGKQTQTEFTF